MQLPRASVALRGYARVGKIGGNEERESAGASYEGTVFN